MSQGSDAPKTKSLFETLIPAIIGLVGVLVGSLITTGANYLLAVRSEQVEQAKTEQARNAEVRVAARLVADQLSIVGGAALFFKNTTLPKHLPEHFREFQFPVNSWDQNKAVLAREIDIESFLAVRQAVDRASSFQGYLLRDANLQSPRDQSAAFKSYYEDIMRGVVALEPYMVDRGSGAPPRRRST